MRKNLIFGVLALLSIVVILAGCKTTGQAYYVNDDLTVSGKAGIGTTSPGSKLDVVGGDEVMLRVTKTASGTPAAIVSGGYIIMDGGAYGIRGGTGQGMYLGANNADIIYISTQGNVGIGTTTPNELLHLVKTGGEVAITLVADTAQQAALYFGTGAEEQSAIYMPANTDDLIIWHSTTGNAVTFKAGGNVGIGTTTPAANLEVMADNVLAGTGAGQFLISGKTNTAKRLTMGIDTTGNFGWIQPSLDGAAYYNLLLNPNGGNVGIGTVSPAARLEITSGGNTNPNIQINSAEGRGIRIDKTGGGETLLYLTQNDVYNNAFLEAFGGGETPLLARIDGVGGAYFAGKVGIGTTNPQANLHINGNMTQGYNQLILESVDSHASLMLKTDTNDQSSQISFADKDLDNAGWIIYSHASDSLNLGVNQGGAELTLSKNGNVGIGTTSPAVKLDVAGSGRFTDLLTVLGGFDIRSKNDYTRIYSPDTQSLSLEAKSGILIKANTDQYSTGGISEDIVFYGANGQRMIIDNKYGYVGIGAITPSERLDVAGNVKLNGKLLMKSSNGKSWCCGPSTTGTWSCTASTGTC